MSLSREEAQNHGLAFSVEDERYPSDPDQPHFAADLTVDGHTLVFQGKSEEEILVQAERALIASGRIEAPANEADNEQGENQPSMAGVLDKSQIEVPQDAADTEEGDDSE